MEIRNAMVCTLMSVIGFGSVTSFASNKVIYGQDNRMNVMDTHNPMYQKLADSTVALMQNDTLQPVSPIASHVSAATFRDSYALCSTERFGEETTGAFCSGSLIGKDLILTAGHCVRDQDSCNGIKFVFGFAINTAKSDPSAIDNKNVYGCKKVIHTQLTTTPAPGTPAGAPGDNVDFAIVQLDREVTDHEPLKMSSRTTTQRLEVGTRLLMIGHPAGIPTKIEDGGKVRSTAKPGYMIATTDSYGGNSGSAVFNLLTGEIEGVLVRGEQDFEVTRLGDTACRVSKVCDEGACRGEDITEISFVTQRLRAGI